MYKNIPEDKQSIFTEKVRSNNANLNQNHGKSYKYPTTKQEYWETVNEYWPELLAIILRFAPATADDGIRTPVALELLKIKEDVDLIGYFNKTWNSAPDDGRIHLISGWNILCDLCSESYLVDQE